MSFDIRQHVEFDPKGRAGCPCCELNGKTKGKTLSLVPGTDGAYKCFRGCSPQDIREALGQPKAQVIPTAIATATKPSRGYMVPPKRVVDQMWTLLADDNPARQWLNNRGITDDMIAFYRLGLCRAMAGQTKLPAIAIPIPNDDRTQYWLKKRVAPWLTESESPAGYSPWSQSGIPARVWFAYCPEEATETWLCEGEWDAMMLGFACHLAREKIAVASFTCGAGNVPPQTELDKLPGLVRIFYDRNDEPLQNGQRPGEVGAEKAYRALGDRAAISLVPMPVGCQISGWDVTNAMLNGYGLADFKEASLRPEGHSPAPDQGKKQQRLKLVDTATLIAEAPDYVDWLVPELLPANEMILLAGSPRSGKSLLSMLLAKVVATGGNFLDRPVTQGPVIYVACEDAKVKLKQRIIAQEWPEGAPVYWLDKFKLSQLDELKELIQGVDARLLVLDTLSRVRDDAISESSAEMSRILEPVQEMCAELNLCTVAVHHTSKFSMQDEDASYIFDSIRGSSAIRATCRGALVLANAKDTWRLYAENGYGKQDLKIRLETSTLEWKLLGRWSEVINTGQQDVVLAYLSKVGQATLDQIFDETQIPKASLYKVLSRLTQEGMLTKRGNRRCVLYTRSSDPIRLSDDLSDDGKPDHDSNRGAIRQEKDISFSSYQVDKVDKVDKRLSLDEEKPPCPLLDPLSTLGNTSDCQMNSPNPVGAGDTPSDKSSDSLDLSGQMNSTSQDCQMKQGDRVLVWQENEWVEGVYVRPDDRGMLSHLTRKIHNSHQVMVRRRKIRVSEPDIRLAVETEGDA